MKIRVIKRGKNDIELEIEGEGHTFCNILRKTLFEDESVEYAGYTIDHPLVGIPRFYVRTNGSETPEEALIKAASKIIRVSDEFKEEFLKAVKTYQEGKY